jgi:hypothetical protein
MGFFSKDKKTKNVNQYKKIINAEDNELEEIKRDMDEYHAEAKRLSSISKSFSSIEDLRQKIEKEEAEIKKWTDALNHIRSLKITKKSVLDAYENKILEADERKKKLLKSLIELTEWENEMMSTLTKHSKGIVKSLKSVDKSNDEQIHQLAKDIKNAYKNRKHFKED